ncbi:unnamed protein product, partial [Gongylonema pulchrum]|uniref:Syntaxin-5_N domain-containing protein n=1 Tax=Gongylonema pulchrum TaxID=637853 RepID=A0A183ETB8_9BILA
MTELPLRTVTRRRVALNNVNPEGGSHGPEEDESKSRLPKASPFSPFSTLSASLWSSAQRTLSGVTTTFAAPENNSSELSPSPPPPSLKPSEEMPSRDRTAEFRTTAKSYQVAFCVLCSI